MTQNKTELKPDHIFIQHQDRTGEDEHEFRGNSFRVSDTDIKYTRASLPKPVDVQGLKRELIEGYGAVYDREMSPRELHIHHTAEVKSELIDHLIKKGIICDETSV